MPLDSDVFRVPPGYNAPQQVHITQGDHDGKAVIVSWVTEDEPGSSAVLYWSENTKLKKKAQGKFLPISSTITPLYNTRYYYEVGLDHTRRTFWFTTPPAVGPNVPYTFGLIGDLGQSFDSNSTLTHYEQNPQKGQTVLFVERSVAYQPWIWTAGNHEIDFAPEIGEKKPFKPYTHRYHVPFQASNSTMPFWYSIKRASAYIIVLSSYSAYGIKHKSSVWLYTCMLIAEFICYKLPLHGRRIMRVIYEPWFVQYKVDVVFAGHVHAYERSERVSNIAYNVVNGICTPVKDQSAPHDGATAAYSAYREASSVTPFQCQEPDSCLL
ncbi:Purple acid phosphatase [Hibiscus syriacus]|uniref:Purple acid phosphatase n=1 Tax=Hibiscus syriacus TaxID=106335 RepID=A0A6A2ZGC8_HIBSY|nr:Purple acid phosphatase [Hibiscus syriacus]